jgi:uncharacterized protein
MRYEWDSAKSERNKVKHGCTFDRVVDFDWSIALEVLDDRFDYGEERWLALGPIGHKLYALSFSPRGETRVRVISLRPASRVEKKRYAEEVR